MKAIKHIFNLILCVFILVLKMCEFDFATYIVSRLIALRITHTNLFVESFVQNSL